MDIKSYRVLFTAVTIAIALLVALPLIGEVLPKKNTELFSEIWILGPDHVASGYPSIVDDGEINNIFVGGRNEMGETSYYMVCVKILNDTFSVSDENLSLKSSSDAIYEFKFFVRDGDVWEIPIAFKFENLFVIDNVLSVQNFDINGINSPIEASTMFDYQNEGFFFDLAFELWRYDVQAKSFVYDGRFVSLRLKMGFS